MLNLKPVLLWIHSTGVVALTENVKPEVKAAKVTGTKTIEVTFSEAITACWYCRY